MHFQAVNDPIQQLLSEKGGWADFSRVGILSADHSSILDHILIELPYTPIEKRAIFSQIARFL